MEIRSDFSSSLDLNDEKLPVKHWLVVKCALRRFRDMSKRVFVLAIFLLHAVHTGPRYVCLMWCLKSLLFELLLLLRRAGDVRCFRLLSVLLVLVLLYGLTIFICEWPSLDAGRLFWRGASVSVWDGSPLGMSGFMARDDSWKSCCVCWTCALKTVLWICLIEWFLMFLLTKIGECWQQVLTVCGKIMCLWMCGQDEPHTFLHTGQDEPVGQEELVLSTWCYGLYV